MAEDSFKNLVIGFALMSLFGMLILTAVIEVGGNYGKDTSEVVGGSLALDKFNESISGLEQDSKDLEESFSKQNIWDSAVGVVVEGFFGIGLKMITLILLPFDIVSDIMLNNFGVPSFVTSVVLALIIFCIMFAIFRLMKVGD